MEGEQLRVFLILHAFFQGVCALSREYHDKTITAERLADRVEGTRAVVRAGAQEQGWEAMTSRSVSDNFRAEET